MLGALARCGLSTRVQMLLMGLGGMGMLQARPKEGPWSPPSLYCVDIYVAPLLVLTYIECL